MITSFGHLSYCSNVHPGETWQEHFKEIKKNVPIIKSGISETMPFGIGLRLSDIACTELGHAENLKEFKDWLDTNNCYVFTMNGFPFGNFHHQPVKENVHLPDWTTPERVNYTVKLFNVLRQLLPEGLNGSISTSPLSYRHWFKDEKEIKAVYEKSTLNILEVIDHLARIYIESGKLMHLNIEPEPDGLLENVTEFIEWYNAYYIPAGLIFLEKQPHISGDKTEVLRRHLRLCFDVCHSAVAYEKSEEVFNELKKNNISIGKVQISSALKIDLANRRREKIDRLRLFNEPIYLHQVIARDKQNNLFKFKDLSQALDQLTDIKFIECRVHFHVPVFSESYDVLSSTQDTIIQAFSGSRQSPICNHWEVETYTWNILPENFQLPVNESIIRELKWVLHKMNLTMSK